MNKQYSIESFQEIWFVDFEFITIDGGLPKPVCLVAIEYRTGKVIRLWEDEIDRYQEPPYGIGKNSLFVAYYSSAEMGCHLVQGWQLPNNVIDFYVEFKNKTNNLELPCNYGQQKKSGRGLIDALRYYGLNTIGEESKEAMRNLILGGKWNQEDKEKIMDYCESDVEALRQLFPKIIVNINIGQALLRGEYMKATAIIEHNGIPIDYETFQKIKNNWETVQEILIEKFNEKYNIFEGRTFKRDRFEEWLINKNIKWQKLDSGQLDLKDETFRQMARVNLEIAPIREIRNILSKMRLLNLAVGSDHRNRCLLSAFGSKTSRNQPSNTKSIFGPSVWLRGLIKPEDGSAIAYIDWSQQEFGIAASLSKDENMMKAYKSGDPYLEFAKQAGTVPPDATKASHSKERELYKQCALGVLYGMGVKALSERVGDELVAGKLIKLHRKTYPVFWNWSESILNCANTYGYIETVFGWKMYISSTTKPTTIRNFPMQANGAEMMRLACCFAIRNGIRISMPVHDAILIEAPVTEIDESIRMTQEAMARASREVLSGFELSSDVKKIIYPDRYMDPRGVETWDTIHSIICNIQAKFDKGVN